MKKLTQVSRKKILKSENFRDFNREEIFETDNWLIKMKTKRINVGG